MSQKIKVLIADDESDLRKYLRIALEEAHPNKIEFLEAVNGQETVDICENEEKLDLIFLDVKMPEMDGLQALEEISQMNIDPFVVMITAHGNIRDAVSAIKMGAYDYLEKPLDKQGLLDIFQKTLDTKQLVEQVSLSFPILETDIDSEIIGHSKPMKEVFDLIKKISKVDSTVMLRGENGTGKELVARAIHFNSDRKNDSFVTVNCAAIPDGLVESELFGHEKGAFTDAVDRKIGKFQLANNGTLFLDEIGELKLEVQAKLLRALQDKTFTPVGSTRVQKTNARIITATNRNLEKFIEEGKFREDLYFRLNVMPIFIPPLRERKEDIPYLVHHFLNQYCDENNKQVNFNRETLEKLIEFDWPGNIRQLQNVIQRLVILTPSGSVHSDDLPPEILNFEKEQKQYSLDFEKFKEDSEKAFIEKALLANGGKINKTVANANIPKNTLLRKIKKYNIDVKQFGSR